MAFIKQINAGGTVYDIDALKWNGHEFSDIESMVHGVVDTYVIAAQTSGASDYKAVVESSAAQVSTTLTALNTLTSSSSGNTYKVGDVILMGATSDGTNNFDRWVSKIDGSTIYLDVLETQVATHHHTITRTSANALTGVSASTTTTNTMAKVGTAVTVATGGSGGIVTSVAYSDEGSHNLAVVAGTSASGDGVGHSHTVSSHNHSVSFTPNILVSRTIEAVTSLTSADYTPHKHTANVTAAGSTTTDSTPISYVYGGGKATFITSLKDSTLTTGSTGLTTESNTDALSTSTTASTEKTSTVSSHVHSVSATTTENVVKTVSLAGNVTTSASLNYTAPTVATTVVTGVTHVSKTAVTSATLTGTTTFMSTWTASVDASGVLSFNTSTATVGISAPTTTVASISSVSTGTQSAGSAVLTTTSATQSYTSGTVTATCNTGAAGEHSHGFSHSHTIAAHTHTIASHTHSYVKSIKDGEGSAYVSLSTSSYTPHTHAANVTAAGSKSDDTKITYIKEGSKTSVVQDLLDTSKTLTTTSAAPGTDTKYYKISGDITYPGLTVVSKDISTLMSTTEITPAASSGEQPLKSITFTSATFINSVTEKTSANKGGN
jgi:hypothetical protein